jgi:hypothetical protein
MKWGDGTMPDPLRIFISSVQKELELERAAVAGLIATDPFLLQHCVPVLFEKEPPSARPATYGYLDTLRACQLYVLILANEYGQPDGDLSATHREYREAQKLGLPTVIFLKGAKDDLRCTEVRALIEETKQDGFKYIRFHDREDLKPLMLDVLRRALAALAKGDILTSKKVQQRFKISAPVVHADFKRLLAEGLIEKLGAGRATRYRLRLPKS